MSCCRIKPVQIKLQAAANFSHQYSSCKYWDLSALNTYMGAGSIWVFPFLGWLDVPHGGHKPANYVLILLCVWCAWEWVWARLPPSHNSLSHCRAALAGGPGAAQLMCVCVYIKNRQHSLSLCGCIYQPSKKKLLNMRVKKLCKIYTVR